MLCAVRDYAESVGPLSGTCQKRGLRELTGSRRRGCGRPERLRQGLGRSFPAATKRRGGKRTYSRPEASCWAWMSRKIASTS